MSTHARTTLLLAALSSSPLAQAVGLGPIEGHGALGARLEAFVPLYLAPGEYATLTGVDVLPDVFARDGTAGAAVVARLARDGARPYLHVTTDTPLRVERLHFRLRVNTTRGAVVARYALRIAPHAVRTHDIARIVARSRATVAAPAAIEPGTEHYGPVRSGESLWTIAKHLPHGGDLPATMRALHALNPEAFVGGDMNRLRSGVVLRLPAGMTNGGGAQQNAPVPEASTDRADIARDAEASPATPSHPAPASANTAAALLREDTHDSTAESTTTHSLTTPQDDAPRAVQDEALIARLAELDAKFAAIRAKYAVTTPSPVVIVPDDTAASEPTTTDTATGDVAPRSPTPAAHDGEREMTLQSPLPRAPTVAPTTSAPSVNGRGLPDWLALALAAGLLLGASFLGVSRLKRRFIAGRTQATAAAVRATDAGRRAEVARKAENRVRLESEIEDLRRRKQTPTAAVRPTGADVPPMPPFEQTLDALAITPGGVRDQDREVAIDANIAHGRYAEAEALLREMIKTHPRNVQAKLRLAEVHYITEQIDAFAAAATDLKTHHRGDLTDEEWQRVVRMGKIIAPDLALFSAPRIVEKWA